MKQLFPLSSTISDWLIAVYVVATLYVRFLLESQLNGHILISVALGIFGLLFIWALMKSKIINPTFFGMYTPPSSSSKTS